MLIQVDTDRNIQGDTALATARLSCCGGGLP